MRTPKTRPRDSAATKQHITDTAAHLLAEKGFTGLGVNAVAAAAGVDKQLIYYHFGGLDGVIRQLGAQLELWLGAPLQARAGEPYAEAANRLLMEYLDALRHNNLVQRLLAWELVEPSDVLKELEVTRSKAMGGWVQALRQAAQPAPEGVDAPAINAVLLAGLQHLALRERAVGSFAGVEIASPQGRERIARAIEFITARAYAPSPSLAPKTSSKARPSNPRKTRS